MLNIVVILGLLLFVANPIAGQTNCPWAATGLTRWSSSANGWTVPTANANVVIDNKKILLDVSPPQLTSITIINGGQLVWDNVDGLELITNNIRIESGGRFDIGSETCTFNKKATITLTGKDGVGSEHPDFGRKYIGVGPGGTIEFHGKDPSPSWTQLAATASSNNFLSATAGRGLTLSSFDPITSSVIDTITFDTHDQNKNESARMASYINDLPTGTLVTIAARDDAASAVKEELYLAIESLGSTLIRNLTHRSSFALIGKKGGAKGSAFEKVAATTQGNVTVTHSFAAGELGAGSIPSYVSVSSGGWADGNFIRIEKIGNLQPVLTLKEAVKWQAGDRIILTSTDFNYQQVEEVDLIACPECTPNQVKISSPLKYVHFGEIDRGVDMRGEVGLLTRSILVRSRMEPSCYQTSPSYLCDIYPHDTFGGHLKVIKNFTNAHIENAEFFNMGQLQKPGFYPVHFHMADDVDAVGGYTNPAYVKNCAIHHSFSRCLTIHATNGLLAKGNIGYDSIGHCFFIEDGIETRNVLDGNLGLVTRAGILLPSDRNTSTCLRIRPTDFNGNPTSGDECNAISTFWVTNPANDLINNVAAGSDDTGIWYIFPDRPTGPSYEKGVALNIRPTITPLGRFENNRAHSNGLNGLFFDKGIKSSQPSANEPQEYLSVGGMRYKPREDPRNSTSPRKPAVLTGFTAYKNKVRGVWVRGGDFRFINARFSDNPVGMTLASEGVLPNDPGSTQTLVGGIFIGESKNVGNPTGTDLRTLPDRNFPTRGFEVYDGPVAITDVQFYGYKSNANRNISAIGWLLHNSWQLSPYNNISRATFDDSDRVLVTNPTGYFGKSDGDLNSIFRDLDGSVSGIRGASVVNEVPYFTTYRCTSRPSWRGQVCHEQFGMLFINNLDAANTNYNGNAAGIVMVRDEKSDYMHQMKGIPGSVQFQPLVIIGKTYTLHWNHATPPKVRLNMINFHPGYSVRIGVCYPASNDISFVVTSFNGTTNNNVNMVDSLAKVDADPAGESFYYDKSTGLVFIKLVHKMSRIGDNYCSPRGCENIAITASGAAVGTNTGSCPTAYPKYAVTEQVPSDPGCIGELDVCGVCNGDGKSCCANCESSDPNSQCVNNACVCKDGFVAAGRFCVPSGQNPDGITEEEEFSVGSALAYLIVLTFCSLFATL